jgi:glycosyltransferase involved in cell wall biosynthesis
MTQPLTVLIPCKNEREQLAACIGSVQELATEVLVADNGSTDGSLEIARALGARIIEREYRTYGDFLNWAIPQATHPWLLVLDSDERITSRLAAEIRAELERPQYDGYRILRRNHFLGRAVRFGPWHSDRCLRLFRRDLGRYEGPSDHGSAQIAGGRVGEFSAPMDHYTITSWEQWIHKLDRYSRVQAAEWHAAGRRPSYWRLLFTPPLRFFRDYVIRRGFMDGAIGLQISWSAAFYSFMKQARLWELHHAQVRHESGDAKSGAKSSSQASAAGDRTAAA